MRKRATPLSIAICVAYALAALSSSAHAREAPSSEAGVEVLADAELSELRGGLRIGGIHVNFGVTVITILNGSPVLTTNITVTAAGRIVDQTVADVGQALDELSDESRAALGLDDVGEDATGIVIEDANGITALVHNVTEGALQNIIVNTATGRDLSQSINITLDLPGFELIQSELNLQHFGFRLQDDMMGAARPPGS